MGLNYLNLDAKTRGFMLQEIALDCTSKQLYISPRLNTVGQGNWEKLLKASAQSFNDDWLVAQLRAMTCFNSHENRIVRGVPTNCKVPITAAETLSEGEFNRFYCRGLCARAISEGKKEVEVYRAKQVENPRPESQNMIGKKLDPAILLKDLRINIGLEPALGLPKVNSGLSLKL